MTFFKSYALRFLWLVLSNYVNFKKLHQSKLKALLSIKKYFF